MTHNIQHICELPPLYEVERGLGGEYKKAKMKRCVQRVAFEGGVVGKIDYIILTTFSFPTGVVDF